MHSCNQSKNLFSSGTELYCPPKCQIPLENLQLCVETLQTSHNSDLDMIGPGLWSTVNLACQKVSWHFKEGQLLF